MKICRYVARCVKIIKRIFEKCRLNWHSGVNFTNILQAAFAQIFLRQKKLHSQAVTTEKLSKKHFHMKKARAKCLWNWHSGKLLDKAVNRFGLFTQALSCLLSENKTQKIPIIVFTIETGSSWLNCHGNPIKENWSNQD